VAEMIPEMSAIFNQLTPPIDREDLIKFIRCQRFRSYRVILFPGISVTLNVDLDYERCVSNSPPTAIS
jgi:hypothetical protein